MNEDAVLIRDITFSYPKGAPVLANLSLTVRRGEFLVLTGPNGSGKTTLLKIMLGLLNPQAGLVRVNTPPGRGKNRIGYVPQISSTYNQGFPATVEEVIAAHLPFVFPGRREAINKVLEKVGLREKRKCLLGSLSGGQLQRVNIARALVVGPDMLLLDEPYTGLDAQAQADFTSLLFALHEESLTVVMVTHDPAPFLGRASRVIRIEKGRAIETAVKPESGGILGNFAL
ncbi:MAG: metal ABC transporter ATP-binding protein [Peptococcaceae bacterium]|jgi:zinc transport system ATP-binding protein|nr:metal ABC transporter ATP-binding protein [Peptococcaceae bacterium]MDH7524622.1 metal ABC transporter ATP-binding protein [Peptococcaceae bacterium]